MSETIWHERLKLSCKIQPFKNSRWKSTAWRCEHYLINWEKYFHSVRTAQPTEWLIIHFCVISITGNCFHSQSKTRCPPSCLQFCHMFTDLKSFFHRHTHTHTHLTALCPRLPREAGTRKVKPDWILLKQEAVSGSGISWAICKSAPRFRQITTPTPHHSFFTGRLPFLPPNQQRQSTEGTRQYSDAYKLW